VANSQSQTDPAKRRERVTWPSPAQALRQIGIIILICVVWSGLLAGYLQLTKPQGNEPAAAGTQPATQPTDTPASLPAPTQPPALTNPTAPPKPPALTNTPAPTGKAAEISFAKDVLPIFQKSCVRCHGSRKAAGLDVQTYASVMKGAQGGPVIKPGNASSSILVESIVSGQMPPGGSPLSPAEIQTIRAWVEAGAPDN
jgi:mono/diheme cytochrome c family protein